MSEEFVERLLNAQQEALDPALEARVGTSERLEAKLVYILGDGA